MKQAVLVVLAAVVALIRVVVAQETRHPHLRLKEIMAQQEMELAVVVVAELDLLGLSTQELLVLVDLVLHHLFLVHL
jgi:hypothetical protein